jgi:hypothetical protein
MVAVGAVGWDLDFYDENRPFAVIGDLVPGAGDAWERARRNGARPGAPCFTGPDGDVGGAPGLTLRSHTC